MENFKSIISKRRKELKMTQRELAEKINVSDKTISKWETGGSYPEITLLRTLAKALEMDVSVLLGATDMSEKELDNDEGKSYDYGMISKYKTKVIISIGMFIIGIILFTMGASAIFSNTDINIIIIILGVITFLGSIILFIVNQIIFRDFFNNKFYRKEYDIFYFKYTIAYLQFYIFIFLNLSLYLAKMSMVLNIGALLSLVVFYFIYKTYTFTSIKPKKDLINKILISLSIILLLYYIIFFVVLHTSNISQMVMTNLIVYIIVVIYLYRFRYVRK